VSKVVKIGVLVAVIALGAAFAGACGGDPVASGDGSGGMGGDEGAATGTGGRSAGGTGGALAPAGTGGARGTGGAGTGGGLAYPACSASAWKTVSTSTCTSPRTGSRALNRDGHLCLTCTGGALDLDCIAPGMPWNCDNGDGKLYPCTGLCVADCGTCS